MPSFLSGWGYRKAIKYGTTKPGSNLTAFPTLLKIIADTDIGAVLSSRKFAVTDTDGTTQLAYGNYNDFAVPGGACTFSLRFKQSLSSAAATGDVIGYLYYDQSQTDQTNRAGVMDGNFVLFIPMEEDPSGSAPQMYDWVTGTNIGTSQGSMTSGELVAAEVANGLDFNGSSQYVDCGTAVARPTALTVSAWIKPGSVGGSARSVVDRDDGGSARLFQFRINTSSVIEFIPFVGGSPIILPGGTTISTGVFSRVDGTIDGTNTKVYLNGASDATPAGGGTLDTGVASATAIANRIAAGSFFQGTIDEVQISSAARSADWLAYSYQNDKNNSTTVTLGTQETPPTAVGGLWLIRA